MRYFQVRPYHEPIVGGHKVYAVYDHNGQHIGVWHEKRQKMKLFSSLENATKFAGYLNAGTVRSSYDNVTDVLRPNERPTKPTEVVHHVPRTRIVAELSERPYDTNEILRHKREQRQVLKSSGLWLLLGYTLHNDGTVTEPVQKDVAALDAITR